MKGILTFEKGQVREPGRPAFESQLYHLVAAGWLWAGYTIPLNTDS